MIEFASILAENIALGMRAALSPENLFYCFVGVLFGKFIGVLPGLGPLVGISILLPVTFHLDPTAAIVMLSGIYYGSAYGGSVASILLNIPGTPVNAVTCLDGYPMARQGRAGVALFITAIASFFGASIGIIFMMLFSPLIVSAALEFGPAEYASMIVLGLVAASTVSTGAPARGIAMVLLGLLLGIAGSDVQTGVMRFTFGQLELVEGIPLVVVAMGLFGVSEVIHSIRQKGESRVSRRDITFRSMLPSRDDMRRFKGPAVRGTLLGSFFGALPGTGGAIAAFMSYAVEQKVAEDPSRFGKGAIEGVIAPEAANNAADQTAFIPTLTLGIPGSAVMALMLAALMIHGISPGPQLMTNEPELFWGVLMSFWIGNLMLLVLSIPLIGIWIRILLIPYHYLYPAILLFAAIGVYTLNNSVFDIYLVILFGGIGYLFRLLDLPPASLLLGFVLGPMLEENFRRAMLFSRGDFGVFIERPISAAFVAITGLLLLINLLRIGRTNRSATT